MQRDSSTSLRFARNDLLALTGGLGFVYEHITGKMIPGNIVLWAAGAFFVTGAFMVWREQYRSNRPIEIRERLDAFRHRGQKLLDLWRKKRRPRIRTWGWNRRATQFVKNHFDIEDYDYLRSNIVSSNKHEIESALMLAPSWGKKYGFDPAQLLEIRLEVLTQLRKKIPDTIASRPSVATAERQDTVSS